jgi:tRNA dimethylallyltransferase
LSIALAKHYNTCILSADSRQFYKELSIGTAKPGSEEQDGVHHFFIDSHSIEDEVSSARFAKEALEVLEREFKTKDVIILVGGSGMFIDALCIGLDSIPSSPELRAQIQQEYESNGLPPLLDELKQNDEKYYVEVDQQNPMRIIRAIEVIRLTGKPFSSQRTSVAQNRPFKTHRFVIQHDRERLYERINLRVDLMMEAGLLSEVESVIQHRKHTSLNTVGYKELFEYLDGDISLEHAIELIKRNSRRYAKRQLTWFKRHPEAIWIDYAENSIMVDKIVTEMDGKFSANEPNENLE